MSLATSIFCSICKNPYDGITNRARHGSCTHLVCEQCQNIRNSDTCPLCGKENAFKEVVYDYQFNSMLHAMNEMTTEESFEKLKLEPKKLNFGTCTTRNCSSEESLRLCVTCSISSGLMEKLPSGELMLLDEDNRIQKLKNNLVCTDCILEKVHEGHEFIPLAKIPFETRTMEFWSLLMHGVLLEQKIMKEEKEGKEEKDDELKKLKRMSIEYRVKMIHYSIFTQGNNLKTIESVIKLTGCIVNIHQLPELFEAKEKSFQIGKSVYEENLKLRERELMYDKERLDLLLQEVKENYDKSDEKAKWENIREQFLIISKKFGALSIYSLNQEEVERIDQEGEEKMNQLVNVCREDTKVKEDVDLEFFRFRALKNEIRESEEQTNDAGDKISKAVEIFDDFISSRLETIHEMQKEYSVFCDSKEDEVNGLNPARKLFLYETTDRSLLVDKTIIKWLETGRRVIQSRLMLSRYFPSIPKKTLEMEIYLKMFDEERFEERSWVHQVFSASFFDS